MSDKVENTYYDVVKINVSALELIDDTDYESSSGNVSQISYKHYAGYLSDKYLTTWDSLIAKAAQNMNTEFNHDDETIQTTFSGSELKLSSQNYVKCAKYMQLPSESIYNYLCRSHILLTDAINSGDLEGIKMIIDNTFLPDAKIKTDKQKDFIIGSENLYKLCVGLLYNVPDYIGNVRVVQQDDELMKNVITVEVLSVGTRVNIPNHQYTETIFSVLNVQNSYYDPKIQQAKDFMKQCYVVANKASKFLAKTKVCMILNQELTHIEFCVAKLVSLEAAHADIQVSFR